MALALIDPLAEINTSHFRNNTKGLMRDYCALIHGVHVTPFPSTQDLLSAIQGRIAQIVYIYHGNQENSPEVYSRSGNPKWTQPLENMNAPSFYGLVEHTNNEVSIVCLLRKSGFTDIAMLQGMIDHYDRLSSEIESFLGYQNGSIIFSGVGILPGLINKLANPKGNNPPKLKVPGRVITHNDMKNKNSARFVAEAWRQILEGEFQDQGNLNRVILGHKGNLGKATLKRLGINPTDNYSDIILLDDPKSTQIPEGSGEDLLILDLTHGSLKEYLDALRIYRKIVWINEAYPPPSSDVIKYAESIGIKVIHIVGVSGSITPSLTDAYAGAVPCCMASELQEVESVIHREIGRMHPVGDLSLLEMS